MPGLYPYDDQTLATRGLASDISPLGREAPAPPTNLPQAAPLPSPLGGSVPAGMPGTPDIAPDPMEMLMDQLKAREAERKARNAERDQRLKQLNDSSVSHQKVLENLLSANGIDGYMPKPSARQMLSDALANIGMAHLTKGNFTPIQVKRYEDAFKRHQADLQNTQAALNAYKTEQMVLMQDRSADLRDQQLDERTTADYLKYRQQAANAALKDKLTTAQTDLRKWEDEFLRKPSVDSLKNYRAAQEERTRILGEMAANGGVNPLGAFTRDNGLDFSNAADFDKFVEAAKKLSPNKFAPKTGPNGLVAKWQMDEDGNMHLLVGDKNTRQSFVGNVAGPNADGSGGWQQMTDTTRTMVEAAPKVIDLVNKFEGHVNELLKSEGALGVEGLGPVASRIREALTGKGGLKDPLYTRLRTDAGLLQTALMRMHVGARGSDKMMAHFKELIDAGRQDPDNLMAALDEIRQYATVVGGRHLKGLPDAPRGTVAPPPVKQETPKKRPPLGSYEGK